MKEDYEVKVWKISALAGCVVLAAVLRVHPGFAADGMPAAAQAVPGNAEQTPAGNGTASEEKKSEMIEPLSLGPLTRIEAGRNDANPTWTPSGALIAFERSRGDKKEILITRPDGTVVQTIYFQLSEDGKEMKFFFPGVFEETSYNAGISWSPAGDRFVFMSNGGEGNYDLYLRELSAKAPVRLTDHKEKDGQAHWSPVGDR